VPRAIEEGVRSVGWTYYGFDFQDTERYMGIFHEVAPAKRALSGASCHSSRVKFQLSNSRLDFAVLGYQPLATRNGKPLCASCHRNKTDVWTASEFFDKVHAKHVTDKKLDCRSCHVFRKARRRTDGRAERAQHPHAQGRGRAALARAQNASSTIARCASPTSKTRTSVVSTSMVRYTATRRDPGSMV